MIVSEYHDKPSIIHFIYEKTFSKILSDTNLRFLSLHDIKMPLKSLIKCFESRKYSFSDIYYYFRLLASDKPVSGTVQCFLGTVHFSCYLI